MDDLPRRRAFEDGPKLLEVRHSEHVDEVVTFRGRQLTEAQRARPGCRLDVQTDHRLVEKGARGAGQILSGCALIYSFQFFQSSQFLN